MKIIKPGKVIYFSCNSCGCEFAIGICALKEHDGNWYEDCPCCGWNCHTDITKQADWGKKGKQDDE